jgi:hypothetical protein
MKNECDRNYFIILKILKFFGGGKFTAYLHLYVAEYTCLYACTAINTGWSWSGTFSTKREQTAIEARFIYFEGKVVTFI